MNRINELIQELCPGGVPFEPLSAIGQWYGGGTPSKTKPEYWLDGSIPWVSPKDMGRRIVDSSVDTITEAAIRESATKLVPPTSVAMVVRSSILDHTFPTALVPVPVALNQDMKAVVPRKDVLAAYLAHTLRACGAEILRTTSKSGGSVTSINSPQLLGFRIPVPPLKVQQEIVRVLDRFTELEAELAAELAAEREARRRQYAYYRDTLVRDGGSKRARLADLGTFVRGRRFTKSDVVESGIPSLHYGEIYTDYGTWADRALRQVRAELRDQLRYAEPGSVVFAGVGETVEDVGKAVAWLGNEPIAAHDDTFIFASDLNPTYVAYAVQTADFHRQKERHVARAKVKRLSAAGLGAIEIPVPSIQEQERIVMVLGRFHALVNDISIGLPAELSARRKQYAHYRDRLLTFKDLAE
ncbi:restriction endonuclease subunit S [Nocardia alba]|uniref:Type I restriction enzyme S subunit n=1 Tax=Nocardia alba TaxID=225051 RepID=A0A4R1FBZ9_9NOCA|nr:restriction endonuclease subunit S [Nocardia alba]TCJ90249.1 type I restriction enzyme S subunit [Nocardia alba]